METKICKQCKKEKDISNFSKKYKKSDGTQMYSNICKECFNKNDKLRRETEEYKNYKKNYDSNYYNENKDKILEYKKEYHKENQEEILKKKSEYRSKPENREKSKEYIKKYIKNNRDKYYEYRRRNPHIIAWRSILYRTLRYLNTPKEGHTQDMLGYSAVQLKHHIEKLFKEGMSWNNYGEWEIDHIKPLTSFDENDSINVVNALSNLQPLWKEENIKKYNHLS